MCIAAHHLVRGDTVELRRVNSSSDVERQLWDRHDRVYASLIFERSRPMARRVELEYPGAIIGGTGWNLNTTLNEYGIESTPDYSLYPDWRQSIGFTQRGCRFKCPFCVVPQKEGSIVGAQTIEQIWRGDPWPRELLLLDNDFFGQPDWKKRIEEIQQGKFKVSFAQGINVRSLDDEMAVALTSVDYRDDQMKIKRIYTAWDNTKDEKRVFRGLELLVKHGVKPGNIMVYMLMGFWENETLEDCEYRRRRLREFGARPYPMPYKRTREFVGFQRWVVGAYDKTFSWAEWLAAKYRPEKLRPLPLPQLMLEE